jgi:hypothetical protein
MRGFVPRLPQYAFMAWCSARSKETTLPYPLPRVKINIMLLPVLSELHSVSEATLYSSGNLTVAQVAKRFPAFTKRDVLSSCS